MVRPVSNGRKSQLDDIQCQLDIITVLNLRLRKEDDLAKKKWKNPFYTLLIPVGLAFVVTGFAYGFMAFQAVNAGAAAAAVHEDHPLFQWLNRNGDLTMLIELGLLAVLTVGAIATDDWWMEEGPNPESQQHSSADVEKLDQEGTDTDNG